MKPEKTQNNIPKKAISKPNVVSLIYFIIIVIIWVPHTLPIITNTASMQDIVAIFLAPLAIVGLFLAYNSGIALAKYNYGRVVKGNLFLPYLILAAVHIGCVGGCLIRELNLVGYPFKLCFDFCQQIKMTTAVIAYSIVSTVLFLPAYCAIYRYRRWVVKYNLPNPV
jgi:hypothetical protein